MHSQKFCWPKEIKVKNKLGWFISCLVVAGCASDGQNQAPRFEKVNDVLIIDHSNNTMWLTCPINGLKPDVNNTCVVYKGFYNDTKQQKILVESFNEMAPYFNMSDWRLPTKSEMIYLIEAKGLFTFVSGVYDRFHYGGDRTFDSGDIAVSDGNCINIYRNQEENDENCQYVFITRDIKSTDDIENLKTLKPYIFNPSPIKADGYLKYDGDIGYGKQYSDPDIPHVYNIFAMYKSGVLIKYKDIMKELSGDPGAYNWQEMSVILENSILSENEKNKIINKIYIPYFTKHSVYDFYNLIHYAKNNNINLTSCISSKDIRNKKGTPLKIEHIKIELNLGDELFCTNQSWYTNRLSGITDHDKYRIEKRLKGWVSDVKPLLQALPLNRKTYDDFIIDIIYEDFYSSEIAEYVSKPLLEIVDIFNKKGVDTSVFSGNYTSSQKTNFNNSKSIVYYIAKYAHENASEKTKLDVKTNQQTERGNEIIDAIIEEYRNKNIDVQMIQRYMDMLVPLEAKLNISKVFQLAIEHSQRDIVSRWLSMQNVFIDVGTFTRVSSKVKESEKSSLDNIVKWESITQSDFQRYYAKVELPYRDKLLQHTDFKSYREVLEYFIKEKDFLSFNNLYQKLESNLTTKDKNEIFVLLLEEKHFSQARTLFSEEFNSLNTETKGKALYYFANYEKNKSFINNYKWSDEEGVIALEILSPRWSNPIDWIVPGEIIVEAVGKAPKSFEKWKAMQKESQNAIANKNKIKQQQEREAEQKRKIMSSYNERKSIGQLVCLDGKVAFGIIDITISAFVQDISGDNIKLLINDTDGQSVDYQGGRLYSNKEIWDIYTNWRKCK